jgi:diguanylate cyclase (GGDEF)-like protein/PAS domain S-box-containing protein
MMQGYPARLRRAFLVYLGVFLSFLFVADLVVFYHQKNVVYEEYRRAQQEELRLIGMLAREAMFKENYALIEWYLTQWGKEQEQIVQIRAVAENGFLLSVYNREQPAENELAISEVVSHSGRELVTIEMTMDLAHLDALVKELLMKLIWGSAILFLLISATVWLVINRMAIRPLQKEVRRRKKMERRLRQFNRENKLLLESAGEGIISVDSEGKCTFVNSAALVMLGYEAGELLGVDLHSAIHHSYADGERHLSEKCGVVQVSIREGKGVRVDEDIFWRKDGSQLPVRFSSFPLSKPDGRVSGAVVVFHDITEQQSKKNLLLHQANHDSLTGLVNRREFERRLSRAIEGVKEDGINHVLLYLDLDNFKAVNDSSGHQAGDSVLRELSLRMGQQIRDRDTLARLGGDEFGVLLEHCTLQAALGIAEKLREAVSSQGVVWEGRHFDVGVSVGVVVIEQGFVDLEDLLRAADSACYTAKQKGGGVAQVWTPDLVALN